MANKRRYFDHNATTPLSDIARDALVESLNVYGNPSSVHAEGRASKSLLNKARFQVAQRLNTQADHVVFTSGASEAAMTLLTPFYKMGRSDVVFSHLYIGATEHPCITKGGRFHKESMSVIGVDTKGLIDLIELKALLKKHEIANGLPLIAIQAANGETGIIQNISQIANIVSEFGGVLIVDLVQFIGKSTIDINEFGGDFFILSGHKIGGPKGIGAIVSKGNALMPVPLIDAGGQEKGFRSGTEALSLIASFGAAMTQMPNFGTIETLTHLRDKLESGIKRISNRVIIYGEEATRLPNTSYFSVQGSKAETLQIGFDLAGFAVSAGSACSSGKVKQSSVLEAMGVNSDEGAIRVSLGFEACEQDVDDFLIAFEKLVNFQKK